MVKLLSLIGAFTLGGNTIAPIMLTNESRIESLVSDAQEGIMTISVRNDKHFDNQGNLIVGTQDYKETLINAVETQRTFNQENGVTNFEIKNSTTKFDGTQLEGDLQVGRNFAKLINATEYEILNMNVTVDKLDDWGNFTYAIGYEAIVDGERYAEDLYGYQKNQALTDFQIKPGYRITFDTEYEIGSSIEYTDNNFESQIYLPDLGIDFLASQIIEMFNYANIDLNNQAIEYINQTMKTTIESADSITVHSALKNGDQFELGAQISNNEFVSDEYFYVSFTSNDATGTFNMLVHN